MTNEEINLNDIAARWNQPDVIDESRFEIENLVDTPEEENKINSGETKEDNEAQII